MVIFFLRMLKGSLFVGLFILSLKVVRTYPIPMTGEQVEWWLCLSEKLDISDLENIWVPVTCLADLIIAFFLYIGVIKLWKTLQTKRRTNRRGSRAGS
ncbi:hypothetical protein BX592_116124 [Paraburkholderia rhizosphaerae]|uniref:Uncharacterized protein n=1 Tax=Paraburkholderia rhizosphaerae TaxID=480658 RepID=A0A4R8LK78_9BURK|nr:hypothetical protein BX592_116124 [Paraburkholderia rhizosphaerae]